MKRRQLVIWTRLAILVLAAFAYRDFGMLWFASMGWIPFGLAMPPLFTTSPCTYCNSGTQGVTDIHVAFAGIADLGCSDCNNLNTTFIIPFSSLCGYSLTTSVVLCGAPRTVSAQFNWRTGLNLIALVDGSGGNKEWDSPLGAGPVDCQDGSSLASLAIARSSGARCDYTSATATVTPTP